MVTQKPISLKIDLNLLEELDKEASLGWKKRNALINEAIEMYLQAKDAYRHDRCNSHEGNAPAIEVARFIKKYLTPNAHLYLDNITYR